MNIKVKVTTWIGLGQKCFFLVDFKTPQGHFEIIWPLCDLDYEHNGTKLNRKIALFRNKLQKSTLIMETFNIKDAFSTLF